MCGIAGIFNTKGAPIDAGVLNRMTEVIKHRGPDDQGLWTRTCVGLGHRRLSIIDLTALAHQPMISDDGKLVISFNGEVYNFLQLKKELEFLGYEFKSNSDTEVVLKSFQQWGVDVLSRFNGMFAFAVWDDNNKRLFLCRDRYGIKPLYYYFKNGVLVFGSEIKAILEHPDVKVDVCPEALNEYFSFQNIFSDITFFKDIKMLSPGHFLIADLHKPSELVIRKYWDFNFEEDNSITENDAIENLNILFKQGVNRQLVSDVEIGSFLSGGMDSGAITSITAQAIKGLKTFTVGFDMSSASGLELGFDERVKAEYLSNLYKTEQYEIVLKAGDMEKVMTNLIWHLEDPRVGQCYPNYYVHRLASKFVKVALSGAGGDELFAGYPWRYYSAIDSCSDINNYVDKYYNYWQRLMSDEAKKDFFNEEMQSQIKQFSTKETFKKVLNVKRSNKTAEEYVNRSLYFEAKTFLHGLFIVEDKLSMANSLETRVPFMDNDIVEYAQRIPVKLKLKNIVNIPRINENMLGDKSKVFYDTTGDGKMILRKVLESYMPKEYSQGIKQGFSAPDASWFRGESIEYIKKLLLDKKANIYDFLNYNSVENLLNDHFSGAKNNRLLIWSLLSFEWWIKSFLNGEGKKINGK